MVKRILIKLVDIVEGKLVEVYLDNKNVQYILKVGSKKRKLQDIVMLVYIFCDE